ncbi:MAG: hypothetical protein K5894_00740 [Lachnospiraceae bacterium]|nr:hypothetical protein [Lachnospiraceae bacterium]
MNNFKKFLKKLTENASIKLLSVICAILLWMVVVSIDNPLMSLPFSPIPVTVVNADVLEDSGKAFELSDSSRSVTVTVRAERSILSELSRDDFVATVDMSELEGNRVPIEVKATKYSDKIESITSKTEYATVYTENLESSQFRLQAETTGEPADGYAVGSTSLATNVVRVKGPESVVSTIDKAEVKINVSNMNSEIHSTEKIILYDKYGNAVNAAPLKMSIEETGVTVLIYKTKDINVKAGYSGAPAEGYVVSGYATPSKSTITVMGTKSALAEISSVTIPSDAVNVDGATSKVSKTVDISDYLPSGVFVVDSEENAEVTVSVNVEALQSSIVEIPNSNITITNLPNGMSASLTEPQGTCAVSLSGLSDALAAVNPATITGAADLALYKQSKGIDSLSSGVYDVNVAFILPSGVTMNGTATVSVVITGMESGSDNGVETAPANDESDNTETDTDGEENNDDNDDESQTDDDSQNNDN